MKTMLTIANYEVRHIFKDRVAFAIVFVAPFVFVCLFGAVYFSSMLTDVPFAIVDMDNSLASREIVDFFGTGQHFKVNPEIDTYAELERAMREGRIRGGMVIPENFAKKLYKGQSTEILAVYDASNLIWGYNIRKFAFEGIDEYNRQYAEKYLMGMGMHPDQSHEVLNLVRCNLTTWYNPTFSYINFLFMGVVFMILHQLGLLGVTLTIPREKEDNTWIHYLASPLEHWQIVFGKCLPYFIMLLFNYALLLWFSHSVIHVKIEGSIALILSLGLLYTIAIVFLGFFISLHAPNTLQISRYLILLSIPLFMISGYTWPAYRIPIGITGIARLSPFTWMAEAFREVTIKNLGFYDILPHLIAMSVLAIICLALAFTFRKDEKPLYNKRVKVNNTEKYPSRV